jgi:hypothetical protein
MHWRLEDIDRLDADVYDALVEWINAQARDDGEGAVDMDAVLDAKRHGASRE